MEQILFCRNKLSASYPADVILQQKQIEAALVSFSDSLGHNYYRFPIRQRGYDRVYYRTDGSDSKRVEALSSAGRIQLMSFSLRCRADRFQGCAFSSSEQTTRPPTPLNASAIEPGRDTASRPNASSSVFGFELRPMVGEFTDAFCVSSATH